MNQTNKVFYINSAIKLKLHTYHSELADAIMDYAETNDIKLFRYFDYEFGTGRKRKIQAMILPQQIVFIYDVKPL